MITDEPVRGGFPDPALYGVPGIDLAKAYLREQVPRPPLSHLMGLRLTQVGVGSATFTMPASPWLQQVDGTIDPRIAGIAVHVASRVQAAAGPGEVLVSSTVRDLVAGSGLRFRDRGRHELKGLEGEWHLLAVED